MNRNLRIVLPPGSIVVEVPYFYFICELLAKLRDEFNVDNEKLTEYLTFAGVDDVHARMVVDVLNSYRAKEITLERVGELLFTISPTPAELEETVNSILCANGHSHTAPETRAKMGQLMARLVQTPLVHQSLIGPYVEQFGMGCINRLAESE